MLVDPSTIFNITMKFFNIPPPPNTPAVGMRVDFWDSENGTFPEGSSIFFYQTGSQVSLAITGCACICIQDFRHWHGWNKNECSAMDGAFVDKSTTECLLLYLRYKHSAILLFSAASPDILLNTWKRCICPNLQYECLGGYTAYLG